MNCKYCGAALPTQGGHCPQCGRMIPMDQQKQMKEMLDPRWNQYHNINTAEYKSASNGDEGTASRKKLIMVIIGVILVLIIFALTRK